MTRNEARADNNLPPIDGGDELIVPLNVVAGGQASPQDTHMNQNSDEVEIKKIVPSHRKDTAQTIMIKGKADEEEDAEMAEILKRFFQRQGKSVLPKIGAGGEWWDEERWNTELADDLEPLIVAIADKHGKDAADVMDVEYVIEITRKYLRKLAEGRARMINTKTREKLEEAVEDEEQDPADVFKTREDRDSISWGSSITSAVASWAVIEAAHQAERQGFTRRVEKQWDTGPNARDSHAAMNGQRVPIDSNFSNGAYWPGDDNLPLGEVCGCNCSTSVIITEE